jgi:ABC-type multidrug transport system ATPase subunit
MAAATDRTVLSSFHIRVNGLSKRYNREWIFRGFDYSFDAGRTYAITGPNGSGKSTLLQVLWGQVPATGGTLDYYTDASRRIDPETLYHHLAIAAPYMDLIEEFTLEEQIRFHFSLRQLRDGLEVAELAERMHLQEARHKFIGNFSSGMRQRVKLALAFYTKAEVLFLDEPGTNLDHHAFDWYLEQLRMLPAHMMVLIASNEPTEYPENASEINILSLKTGY